MRLGEECGMDRRDLPETAESSGPPAPPPDHESVRERVAHLRERAERTKAGIEARREESASIATVLEAIERDAQAGGGVLAAAVAFRLFMFLVPYAFVMVTGFGLASTAAGQDPGDAARSAGISGLFATAVSSTSTPSLANRLIALTSVGLPWRSRRARSSGPLGRPSADLEGATHPQAHALGALDPHGVRDRHLCHGRPDRLGRLAIARAAVVAFFLTILLAGGAWFLASWLFPRDDCALWALLPGALIVGVGVGVLQILTITYVVHVVTRKSALYGAIGIALALLLWTYFAGRLLTASIAANASLWKHRMGEPG